MWLGFLNFSYVGSCHLPQTFLGNTLWEFPGCSSGCCKADIFRSWGAPDDDILHSWGCPEEASARTCTFPQDVLGRKLCYMGRRQKCFLNATVVNRSVRLEINPSREETELSFSTSKVNWMQWSIELVDDSKLGKPNNGKLFSISKMNWMQWSIELPKTAS